MILWKKTSHSRYIVINLDALLKMKIEYLALFIKHSNIHSIALHNEK